MGEQRETQQETEWERRRRLSEIFGDVEPAVTSDERDDVPPDARESSTDRWLKAQVPPHHGG
ncbi:hypothetical protein RB608_04795 [Nocardioides sp. LHD-245]|uniref:hypothetical protein n=1 Tax=Nocardioides sp. LHD-245 TaxID=3051387 RepID=UPI0027E03D0E|nr:hypothetical protein [Nocardioides sp. LHD-245]